jgi:hypothetical protein
VSDQTLAGLDPGLAPGLLVPPCLRPRRDHAPIPDAALTFTSDPRGEALLLGDLVSALLADAEELGDLDEGKVRSIVGWSPSLRSSRALARHAPARAKRCWGVRLGLSSSHGSDSYFRPISASSPNTTGRAALFSSRSIGSSLELRRTAQSDSGHPRGVTNIWATTPVNPSIVHVQRSVRPAWPGRS